MELKLAFSSVAFLLLTDKNNIFFAEQVFSLVAVVTSHSHCQELAESQSAMRRFSSKLSSIFISIFTELFS
jgi:hypothetical protein